jgi:hypothetical protein
MDQQSTLYPSAPTPFTSYSDVVDRLLPYHVWQIHDEELDLDRGDEKAKHKERMGGSCEIKCPDTLVLTRQRDARGGRHGATDRWRAG